MENIQQSPRAGKLSRDPRCLMDQRPAFSCWSSEVHACWSRMIQDSLLTFSPGLTHGYIVETTNQILSHGIIYTNSVMGLCIWFMVDGLINVDHAEGNCMEWLWVANDRQHGWFECHHLSWWLSRFLARMTWWRGQCLGQWLAAHYKCHAPHIRTPEI